MVVLYVVKLKNNLNILNFFLKKAYIQLLFTILII